MKPACGRQGRRYIGKGAGRTRSAGSVQVLALQNAKQTAGPCLTGRQASYRLVRDADEFGMTGAGRGGKSKEPAGHVRQAQCRFWRYERHQQKRKARWRPKGRRYIGKETADRRRVNRPSERGIRTAMTNAHRQECLCYSFAARRRRGRKVKRAGETPALRTATARRGTSTQFKI